MDMEVGPPIRPHPPVTAEALAAAEARIGFPLPPLVSALYTQVADGGYGPGYGVYRLFGPEVSLVECARWRGGVADTHDEEAWPARLIELVGRAAEKPKARRKTRPTPASREERLKQKRQRGEVKRLRSSLE